MVKFNQSIELHLESDAHVIVVAAGAGLTLGRIYGPKWGEEMPVAVANPVFVDVHGNSFEPNGDMLGLPLPVDKTELPRQTALP